MKSPENDGARSVPPLSVVSLVAPGLRLHSASIFSLCFLLTSNRRDYLVLVEKPKTAAA